MLVGIGIGAAVLLPGRALDMERGLQPAIYYVTNPALMLVLISDADLGAIAGIPVEMLGNALIPLLLLVFGMSLVGQKPLSDREMRGDVLLATAVKLVLMPVIAWAVARFLFGVGGAALFGVVVMAALPSAQNVFLFAIQFRLRSSLVRDVLFLSSLLSLPAVLVVALVLG